MFTWLLTVKFTHTHTLTEFHVCVLCVFQWWRARRRQHAEVIRRSAGCSGLRDSLHGRTSHPVRQHGFNEFWTMIKHQHTGFWVVEFKSLRFWKHFTFRVIVFLLVSERLRVRWAMRTGTLLRSLRASNSSSAPTTGPWKTRLRPASAAMTAGRRCCQTVLQEPEDCPHLRSDRWTRSWTWRQHGL